MFNPDFHSISFTIMARIFLRKIGIALLVSYVFITAYGATRQWMETGSPFRQECIR